MENIEKKMEQSAVLFNIPTSVNSSVLKLNLLELEAIPTMLTIWEMESNPSKATTQ